MTIGLRLMEPFPDYSELISKLDESPAMVVNTLRERVQDDLASNSAAWDLIGRALLKLGFKEQGEESINYGNQLRSQNEAGDELIITFESDHIEPTSSSNRLDEDSDLTSQLFEQASELQAQSEVTSNATEQEFSNDAEPILLMSRGKYHEAMDSWTNLIKEKETIGRWNGLAECLDALGYTNRARKARLRGSSTPEAREAVANVDLEDLAETVRSRATVPPSRKETINEGIEWYNKGISLLRDGKPSEALGCFEKTLYTRAEDTVELRLRAKIGTADAYSALDRHEEAIRAYVQSYEMSPDALGYAAVFNMGNSYTHLGQYEDAIACLNRSAELNPEKDHRKKVKNIVKQVKALKKASKR